MIDPFPRTGRTAADVGLVRERPRPGSGAVHAPDPLDWFARALPAGGPGLDVAASPLGPRASAAEAAARVLGHLGG